MSKTRGLFIASLTFLFMLVMCPAVFAEDNGAINARPSVNGRLSVSSSDLVDKNLNRVLLKGVSLHGITWFPEFISEDLFLQVSNEWDANLLRIPVYPEEYIADRQQALTLTRQAINAAVEADMYVIVDWHVMDNNNPNVHLAEAEEFFKIITSEYAACPNMIYEICNEPNGETTWSDVREYAYEIIPVIRDKDPESLILIGTPDFCKNLISATRNPVKYDNVMYSLHFYAGTHKEDLRREYSMAKQSGLPIFVSECGLSESNGTGNVDFSSASIWFSLLEDNDTSFAIWSLSNKNESSALFKPLYDPTVPFTDDDLSPAGKWVRSLLLGEDPRNIPDPGDGEGLSVLSSYLFRMLETEDTDIARAWPRMALYVLVFVTACTLIVLLASLYRKKHYHVYDDIYSFKEDPEKNSGTFLRKSVIILSVFLSLVYIGWRIKFSIPFEAGVLAVTGNIALLVVEIFGLIESVILYMSLLSLRKHPLPAINDDEYPDVDIFIATYNEPVELLRKTINGCNHLLYPEKSKVHIWLCDDNRRPQMRKLAKEMNVGYFDRPDNKGAKAGNLNNALSKTSAPYIVTLDADMIPRSCFLLKTIPYFVDAAKCCSGLDDPKKIKLGLLQSPQCFYTPDVFQYALYSEKNAPNEQDFFYRTIEVAKTGSNSVIYGGSNTVIAREALESIGGFFTGSITEDFATGMLIESNGYVSLAISEPLASGMTPNTYKEHIQQRKRWGRGVISTAKQLRLITRKGLSFSQKVSYFSSVVYWFSPIKNLVYLLSPMLFACFAIPVFKCGWLDLVIYWLPMFIMQDVALRVFSKNSVSLKWSGIYETSVMPHLLIPIIKETLGITSSVFEVTDKSKKNAKRKADIRSMMPFIILIALCIFGIIRSIYLLAVLKAMGIVVLLFWLIRNAYFLLMSIFLVDGRDGSSDDVNVYDAEFVSIRSEGIEGGVRDGITTYLNIHSVKIFMDEADGFRIGDRGELSFETASGTLILSCIITAITYSRHGDSCVLSTELLETDEKLDEYMQILYDRIPTLPQSLTRDYGIVSHMLRNIAYRILR